MSKSERVLAIQKTPHGQPGDEVLAARLVQGDASALEALYERYAPMILGLAFKMTGDSALAEDVLQETFWRAWKNAVTYQPERGSFAAWLFRIARNLAIDSYRSQRLRLQALEGLAEADPVIEPLPDPHADVVNQAQYSLDFQQVRSALATLPAEQRQVIEMAYFQGMTRQEIADATGEALGTIHTRARLGLQKLHRALEAAVQLPD
jgi:RNA polymerase sigma-70 factor (ECF subfamily)